MSHDGIRAEAEALREGLGIEGPRVELGIILDKLADCELLSYESVPDDELVVAYALTSGRHIKFAESVLNAMNSRGEDPAYHRARFTGGHEIYHALKHHKVSSMLSSGLARRALPEAAYESAEWQANQFAAYLLMPVPVVIEHDFSASRVSDLCHTSLQSAEFFVGNVERRYARERRHVPG